MWDSKNAREYMSFPEAKNAPTIKGRTSGTLTSSAYAYKA